MKLKLGGKLSRDRNYNCDNNDNQNNYGNIKESVGPYVPPINFVSCNRDRVVFHSLRI